jgi:HEAT repeat protein
MRQHALFIVISVIAVVVVSLAASILVMKALRQVRQARLLSWRKRVEPGVLRYLGALEGSMGDFLRVPSRGLGRVAVVDLLLQHADVLKGAARERITTALEQMGVVDEDIARLRSPSAWRRAAAAERLGLARSQRAIEPLARRLEDPAPEARLRAARALGQIGGAAAVKPIVSALSDASRWSTMRVADILSGMGEEAERELTRCFPTLSARARVAAIDVLGRLRRPASVAFLEQRLKDEDPDLRARAAHALGQIGDPTACRLLMEAARDPEWPVRAMAAKSLGRLRSPEAIGILTTGLADRQWWVRSNSAVALRDLGDGGTQALIGVLDSRDEYACHQAVLMLDSAGLVDRYVDRLAEEDAEGDLARTIVRKIADLGRTARLEELSKQHPRERVRTSLAGILRESLVLYGRAEA